MANKKSKKKKKQTKILLKSMKLALKMTGAMLLIIAIICLVLFYSRDGKTLLAISKEAKELVRTSNLDTFRQSETSLVYDTNGKLLSVLKGEKDVYYLDYEAIPTIVKDAIISIEDKKFKNHMGIDIKANFRALLALIRNKGNVTQGASTITQQLSRNIFLSNEISYQRKVKEILISLELEKKYSKYQILEFYLNNIYFANGYYGIQAASKGYFSKSVEKLSLSQIAFLCAIPNNPTIYNPLENKENTIKRRDRILDQMLSDDKISLSDYTSAKDEKIKLKTKTMNKNNYVETFIYNCATKALMKESGFEFQNQFESDKDKVAYEENYEKSYTHNQRALFTGGFRIYTSIDLEKQDLLQESLDEVLGDFKEKNDEGIYLLQGASTCIDNKTGRVVAIVGGREQETLGYTLNRAYQSYRQPGSAIKPLIVYTPALERNYLPNTIVIDEKIKDGPSNANGTNVGKITLRRAVESSTNTIAWKIFEELTPKVGLNYIAQMNFLKIDKNDYYPAASLGGFTNGVNTVEMSAAYSTLENDGIYRDATCIVKILDSENNTIVKDYITEKQIYMKNAARMMTDILTGVVKTGTGKGLAIPGIGTAGKTGTTSQKKDGWFVGYTPYYTTSVWVGYDMPKTLSGLSGATYPGRIWYRYMSKIHEGLEKIQFEPYIKAIEEKVIEKEDSKEDIEDIQEEELEEQTDDLDTNLINDNKPENQDSTEEKDEEQKNKKDTKKDKGKKKNKDEDIINDSVGKDEDLDYEDIEDEDDFIDSTKDEDEVDEDGDDEDTTIYSDDEPVDGF